MPKPPLLSLTLITLTHRRGVTMRRITISVLSILVLLLIVALVRSENVYAGVDEGLRAYKRGDYTTALKEFELAAKQRDRSAHYYLGLMHYNGDGVTRDYKEAFKWFSKAAEEGNVSAQYNLGVMYFEGQGVPRDEFKAVKWWRKAEEQGDTSAKKRLSALRAHEIESPLKPRPKPVPSVPTHSVPIERARVPVKEPHMPSAPKSIESAPKTSEKAPLPIEPAPTPVAEPSVPEVNVEADIADEASGANEESYDSETSRNIGFDEYKVVLGVDALMKIPGIPGALKVWIGAEDSEPNFPETMREARDTVPAVGKSARVTPLAPAFEVEPKESGCMQIHPGGSEKTFYLTPRKKGRFSVGAEVNLFNSDDCGGAPIPRATRTLQVEVVVDAGEVIGEHTKELWEVFWEKLVDFWAALVALFFALILFFIRGHLKKWFGFKKD